MAITLHYLMKLFFSMLFLSFFQMITSPYAYHLPISYLGAQFHNELALISFL